jgi:ubiquinone biosynthesis protein COQ4
MNLTADSVKPGGPLYLSPGAGWIARLRVGVRSVAILDKNADDAFAGHMLCLSMEAGTFERHAKKIAQTEEGRALLAEQPDLQLTQDDLAALRALPDGTLGNLLARYYVDNGIRPFVTRLPVRSDAEYLVKRYREIHDIAHLVTGYGTHAIGEVELQAFLLGNLGLRTPWLAMVYAALVRPYGLPPIWKYARRLLDAYRRGRQSDDVALRPQYEHDWASTMEDVRQRYGMAPIA